MPTITNPKSIQAKSRNHIVTQTSADTFSVVSGNSGETYNVHCSGHGATCSCKWASYRPVGDNRSGCSHVVSVFNHIETNRGRKVSAWGNRDDAKRQKKIMQSIGDGLTLTLRKAA